MQQFWQVKVQMEFENDRGRIQKTTENYLVEAVSPTDAEVRIVKEFEGESNFTVTSITKSKILKVVS